MTLQNQGGNVYKVVAVNHNTWDGTSTRSVLLETGNLLEAYSFLQKEEERMRQDMELYAGSPMETRLCIDVYIAPAVRQIEVEGVI